MATAYAQADDDVDINEPVVMGDLSDQVTSEVLEPASKVPFIIKKASIRVQREDSKDSSSPWKVKRLVIDAAIGADGVDGEGKYANKHLFTELVLVFNQEDFSDQYSGDWWQKQSRGPTKQFFQALGHDPKSLPRIDSEFLSELGGQEFVADIRKRPVQERTDEMKNGKAVYRNIEGEFKNELSNFRAVSS